ncbi:MAG TPA: PQQ-dependent sugar dehydrogenase [Actinomycetota bacterium]|nr:PQQ-dependent sugar dehydrogenase [Actinomycetota bacterium]
MELAVSLVALVMTIGPIGPVAEGLEFPTNLAVARDGRVFFTEKDTGLVRIIRQGRLLPDPFADLDVIPGAETGLLGIALHPDFPDEPWVYVAYSDPAGSMNRLARIRAEGDTGVAIEPLLDLVPATSGYHNGGDLAFGLDGMLYVTVGEAHEPNRAQNPRDLGGKVLRLSPDGSIPPDNPLGPASPVYSLGHRNSFGICVDPESGVIWETENGPSSWDEINRIEPGRNYGWPVHLGPGGPGEFEEPVLAYEEIIVPTGCAVAATLGGLYFGDFHGGLHRVVFPGMGAVDPPPRERVVATFDEGITDVARGPEGELYVATSAAIWMIRAEPTPTPTPIAETSPSTAAPRPAPDGSSPGLALWLGSGAALALVLLLLARFARRR